MTDLNQLLDKATEAVRRDLRHIFEEVSKGKLSAPSSRDLVAYIKLLTDVLDYDKESEDSLKKLSEEELKTLAKSALNET